MKALEEGPGRLDGWWDSYWRWEALKTLWDWAPGEGTFVVNEEWGYAGHLRHVDAGKKEFWRLEDDDFLRHFGDRELARRGKDWGLADRCKEKILRFYGGIMIFDMKEGTSFCGLR